MERKGSQVYLEIGDVVRLRLPHSEVCIHMRLAGEEKNVRLVQEGDQPMAQLLANDGSRWSFPILPGEAGIFSDGPRLYVLTRAVVDMRLRLFVPKPGSVTAAMIDSGSAIVGTDTDAPEVLVDYEGNRHGASNLTRYWGRALQAAGRHLDRYPTVARALVPRADLIPIGWFDVEKQQVTFDADVSSEQLAGWIGLTNTGMGGTNGII